MAEGTVMVAVVVKSRDAFGKLKNTPDSSGVFLFSKLSVSTKFFHCIDHREDILWGYIRHNRVNGCHHITTIFAKDIDHTLDFGTDFIRRAGFP